jgi:hypothetical protein
MNNLDTKVDNFAKWGMLLSIICGTVITLFNDFVPKFKQWRETFPPENYDDYPEENQPDDNAGMVDPVADIQKQTDGGSNPMYNV